MHINRTPIILFLALFLPTVCLFLVPTNLTFAKERDNLGTSRNALSASNLMEPFKEYLSNTSWLIINGLDPRIKDGPLSEAFPPKELGTSGLSAQAGAAQGPLVPYRSPSQKFSRNILVTRDFSPVPFQTEPSLAVDPKDPEHILLGVIDYNFRGVTTYNSIDGGATWEGPNQVKYPPDDAISAGDPVLAFDREGNAYVAQISLALEDFRVGPAASTEVISAIPVSISKDGGTTWEEPIASIREHIDSKQLPDNGLNPYEYQLSVPFLDKPWIAIGPNKEDPTKDIIYVSYTKFVSHTPIAFLFDIMPFLGIPTTESSIELVKSEDYGATWSEPVTVSPIVTTSIAGSLEDGGDVQTQVVQGSQPFVAPDGTLYVAWMDTTDDDSFKKRAEIYVAKSYDNGSSFTSQRAADFNELQSYPRNSNFRYWGSTFPQLAAGNENDVYVAYTSRSPNRDDDGDIYLASSTDGGQSWGKRKINDDNTLRLQFFPSLTVSTDGTVHVMWGDMRDDPVETRYHVYYTSSEDKGKTWTENARVTDFPSNPNHAFPGGRFIGDYFTIASGGDDVYMAWPDARLGEYGPLNQKIGFARKTLMPLPAIFLSPPSGPGGKDITIQGSNFQPHQNVFLEISGAVVSTVRSDASGNFTARLFVPISGEGAHDFRAIDASGNIATSSFFMDFGFDNIKLSIDDLGQQIQSIVKGTMLNGQDTIQELPSASQNTNIWLILAIALITGSASAGIGIGVSIWTSRKRQP